MMIVTLAIKLVQTFQEGVHRTNLRTSMADLYVASEERVCFSVWVKNYGLVSFAPIQGSYK